MRLDSALDVISRNLSSLYVARRLAETSSPEKSTLIIEGVTANGYRVSGLVSGSEGEEPLTLEDGLIALAEEWLEYEKGGYPTYYTEEEPDAR